jgi:hypothetical protein
MSETDNYLDRRAEFQRADAEVTAVARNLTAVGTALATGRGRFSFANCPSGLPAEAVLSRNRLNANANDWKTPQADHGVAREVARREVEDDERLVGGAGPSPVGPAAAAG